MKQCYLCGSNENLTHDHVPPRNLFVEPRPNNLITVDCCERCHKPLSMDDEAFRVFASSVINRSPSGEWIWKNKVLGSSFIRSPKLKQNVRKSLIPLSGKDSGLYGIRFHQSRANLYLIRITKGLIKHFHPELDYSLAKFRVLMINPSQDIVDNTLSKFVYDFRGNNFEFRFWRAFYSEDRSDSVWVYVFYDGMMFMVELEAN